MQASVLKTASLDGPTHLRASILALSFLPSSHCSSARSLRSASSGSAPWSSGTAASWSLWADGRRVAARGGPRRPVEPLRDHR